MRLVKDKCRYGIFILLLFAAFSLAGWGHAAGQPSEPQADSVPVPGVNKKNAKAKKEPLKLDGRRFKYAKAYYYGFISDTALKPYTKKNRQIKIAQKFQAAMKQVNKNRMKAAFMAIDSGKCDYVNSADIVGETYLEYEVICRNGAIIYLNEQDLKNVHQKTEEIVVPEKDKALARSIAMSRCEQMVNNYIFNKGLQKEQLFIDRYRINTLITSLGETIVNLIFYIDQEAYKARCIFRYNQPDSFDVKKKN